MKDMLKSWREKNGSAQGTVMGKSPAAKATSFDVLSRHKGTAGAGACAKASEMLPSLVATKGVKNSGCGCGGKCSGGADKTAVPGLSADTFSLEYRRAFTGAAIPRNDRTATSFEVHLGKNYGNVAVPDWFRRDSGSGGQGPGSSLCRSLEGQIQALRNEITDRWRQTTPDAESQRVIREVWRNVFRGCDFQGAFSPCDAFLPILANFGDPNEDVEFYNELNAAYARCQAADREPYYRSGLGRVLTCAILYRGARRVERRLRRGTAPFNYPDGIRPFEDRLLHLEDLYQRACNGLRVGPPIGILCGEHCWPPDPSDPNGESNCRNCCFFDCNGDDEGQAECSSHCTSNPYR